MKVFVFRYHGIDGWMDILMENPIPNINCARNTQMGKRLIVL